MSNKHWEQNKLGGYELHFSPYLDGDKVVIAFCQDKDDKTLCWYVSELMNVEQDSVQFDSDNIQEAKEEFEYMVEEYYSDQAKHYDDLLDKFQEE